MKGQCIKAWILAAGLLLGLTACGGGGNAGPTFQSAPYYTSEELKLPVKTGTLQGSCAAGESIYFLFTAGEPERTALYRANLTSGMVTELEGSLAETGGQIPDSYWGPFLAADGTLWVWESGPAGSRRFYRLRQLDATTGQERTTVDIGLGMDELKGQALTGLTVDSQGFIYLAATDKIAALDGEGQVEFTLEAKTPAGSMALLPDGTAIALIDVSDREREVRAIDPAAGGWGEECYTVTKGMKSVYSGGGGYRFLCQRNGILYGRLEGEALDTRLVSWDAVGLDSDGTAECFALLDDGRTAVLAQAGEDIHLYILSPADQPGPSDGRVRLVYGTIGDDGWARRRVNLFNEDNDKYYIELRDYAEGMLDYFGTNFRQVRDAAVARLSAEIIAGRAPDILDDRNVPLTALARQGVLIDLWPFIENDPGLGRDAVMSHVLECAETDGKLYRIFGDFRIDTLAASSAAVGNRTSWTLDEMLSAYGGDMPRVCQLHSAGSANPFFDTDSADLLLNNLLRMNLNRYVDWDTGVCSFDTEEFRDILRLCGGAGQDAAAGAVSPVLRDGEPVVYERLLSSVADLALDDAVFGGPEVLTDYEAQMAANGITAYRTEEGGIVDDWLGIVEQARESGLLYDGTPIAADFVTGAVGHTGYAAYIGFPTSSGSGSSFRVSDSLAITGTCADKDGAWQFVRELLLPGGSLANTFSGLTVSYDAFPVNKADFEKLWEPRYFTDNDGNFVLDGNGERIEKAVSEFRLGDPVAMFVFLHSPTQEQRERFFALYDAIDHITDGDSVLEDIVSDGAQAYFSGDKTLEDTAKLIQERAELYVSERK